MDIIAEKRTRISSNLADKMLCASKKEGEVLKALKWALTGTDIFAVSINGKNKRLVRLLECFDPMFYTKDIVEAGHFTGKIFQDVEVLIDENPFAQFEQEIASASNLASIVGKITEGAQAFPDVGTNNNSSGKLRDMAVKAKK